MIEYAHHEIFQLKPFPEAWKILLLLFFKIVKIIHKQLFGGKYIF